MQHAADSGFSEERLVIIGVGLLGASLGLAIKARGAAGTVVGVGRRMESLAVALERGAIDEASLDPAGALRGAGTVVIATPAAKVISMLDIVREAAPPSAVVTDVASTKYAICDYARSSWPAPRRFIGSHPMAGSEKFGPEHGRADLYENSVCLVEEGPGLDPAARERIIALWRAVGAAVADIDPAAHDSLLAQTSHIPHILASAIATLAARQGDIRRVVGNGFRDMTRIAEGRPEIWRDICITNREAILVGLRETHDLLDRFTDALMDYDEPALDAYFEEGRNARRNALGAPGDSSQRANEE